MMNAAWPVLAFPLSGRRVSLTYDELMIKTFVCYELELVDSSRQSKSKSKKPSEPRAEG